MNNRDPRPRRSNSIRRNSRPVRGQDSRPSRTVQPPRDLREIGGADAEDQFRYHVGDSLERPGVPSLPNAQLAPYRNRGVHSVEDPNTPLRVQNRVGWQYGPTRPKDWTMPVFPGILLSQLVSNSFGTFRGGGFDVSVRSTGSLFFYAAFRVEGVSIQNPLRFEEICKFELEAEYRTLRHGAEIWETKTLTYNLLTIVFYRD
ncbi:hypothetical protein PWT90_02842 [Aphanocladium album]|nr:hypothetical protein PWT90_02842 [Aphanocladium album]